MISEDARPCVILMTAARPEDMRSLYPVSELAARDGSSAAEEMSDPDQAFAGFAPSRRERPSYRDSRGLAPSTRSTG